MNKNSGSRWLICLSLILAIAVIFASPASAGLFGRSKKASNAAGDKIQSLVVFPFDVDKEISAKVSATYGNEIAVYLRSMLTDSKRYSIFLFKTSLSSIVRAKDQSELKAEEIESPYSESKPKSLKLAQVLAADIYIVGSVQDVSFVSETKTAQVTLSAELINAKNGESIGNFIVTGSSDESSKAETEDELVAVAAGKAVDSLKTQFLAVGKTEEKKTK